MYVLTARVSWADNEVEHVVDVGIDSRNPLLATANTPGHKSDNIPSTSLGLANLKCDCRFVNVYPLLKEAIGFNQNKINEKNTTHTSMIY